MSTSSRSFYPTEDASAALKRFRAGSWTRIRSRRSGDWLRANLPGAIRQAPTSIDYVVFNENRKPSTMRACAASISRLTATR